MGPEPAVFEAPGEPGRFAFLRQATPFTPGAAAILSRPPPQCPGHRQYEKRRRPKFLIS
jgi:hypothetical protein